MFRRKDGGVTRPFEKGQDFKYDEHEYVPDTISPQGRYLQEQLAHNCVFCFWFIILVIMLVAWYNLSTK